MKRGQHVLKRGKSRWNNQGGVCICSKPFEPTHDVDGQTLRVLVGMKSIRESKNVRLRFEQLPQILLRFFSCTIDPIGFPLSGFDQ